MKKVKLIRRAIPRYIRNIAYDMNGWIIGSNCTINPDLTTDFDILIDCPDDKCLSLKELSEYISSNYEIVSIEQGLRKHIVCIFKVDDIDIRIDVIYCNFSELLTLRPTGKYMYHVKSNVFLKYLNL